MALTTQDGIKRSESVVTDVNANVPAATPAPRVLSPEAAILFNKAIIAKPLGVPQVCDVRIKNSEYRYRWVNRDGMGGRIYTQRKAQGFLNATNDDAEIMGGDASTKDGEIRSGDLILMKIRAELYDGAIKANMVKANVLGNARGMYSEGGSTDVMSDATQSRTSIASEAGAKSKLAQPFIPTNVDALIDDSIKSGRAEKTRQTVDGLRGN